MAKINNLNYFIFFRIYLLKCNSEIVGDPKFLNFLSQFPLQLEYLRRSIHSLHAYTFKILRKSPANKKSKGRLDSISYGTNFGCCSVLCPMFFAVNLLYICSLTLVLNWVCGWGGGTSCFHKWTYHVPPRNIY